MPLAENWAYLQDIYGYNLLPSWRIIKFVTINYNKKGFAQPQIYQSKLRTLKIDRDRFQEKNQKCFIKSIISKNQAIHKLLIFQNITFW